MEQQNEKQEVATDNVPTTTVSTGPVPAPVKTSAMMPVEYVRMKMAETLYRSGMYPQLGGPAGAFAVVQYGHELGLGPVQALQSIHVIKGKLGVSGHLMLAMALKHGVKMEVLEETNEKCSLKLSRNGHEYVSTFTLADAKKAQLCKQGGGYDKYPRDMIYWRAVTRGVRRVCPDVVMGLYTPDEIESDVADVQAANSSKSNTDQLAESMGAEKIETPNEDADDTQEPAQPEPKAKTGTAAKEKPAKAGTKANQGRMF